jgi:hypothetical protein
VIVNIPASVSATEYAYVRHVGTTLPGQVLVVAPRLGSAVAPRAVLVPLVLNPSLSLEHELGNLLCPSMTTFPLTMDQHPDTGTGHHPSSTNLRPTSLRLLACRLVSGPSVVVAADVSNTRPVGL